MHAMLLALVVVVPGQCKDCENAGAGGVYRSSPAAVNCPRFTPPVRWYCKPCAGCAGGTCLATQQPYINSAPYSYRVEFDYPWSQQPAYMFWQGQPGPFIEEGPVPTLVPELETIEAPLPVGPSSRKPATTLRR